MISFLTRIKTLLFRVAELPRQYRYSYRAAIQCIQTKEIGTDIFIPRGVCMVPRCLQVLSLKILRITRDKPPAMPTGFFWIKARRIMRASD